MSYRVDASHSVFNDVRGNQYNLSIFERSTRARDLSLQKLKPAEMDASDRSECLPGTRTEVREFISRWATDITSDKKILWIHGFAGSGKSTLATTIANFFRDRGRLGAFLFFDRDVSESNHPGVVIRTLAYQLGSFNHRIGTAIATTIDSAPNICASPVRFQFRKLLTEPLSSFSADDTYGTVVVVLDALDECGNAKERKNLLALLAKESMKFPSAFRMLITSRAEYDICSAFESQAHVLTQELDITTPSNVRDIFQYFRYRMIEIKRSKKYLPLEVNWPGEHVLEALCRKAVGLFVWASTATEFIDAHDPNKRIDALLCANADSGVESALDALYKTALQSAAIWNDEDFAKDFRDILGIVLVAKAPLSTKAIDNLLDISESRPSIHTISLLRCLLAQSPFIRVLHPSFADFLTTRDRCENKVWFINTTSHNEHLASLCLDRLSVVLKRNICGMTLSSEAVEGDLADDIAYACVFWIDHVYVITNTAVAIADHIDQFLRRHLLHWLEAMSILKRSREIIYLLERLLDWIHHRLPTPKRNEMSEFVCDACRFVQAFAEPIEEHPLLVYLTALPFAPSDSIIFQIFHDRKSYPHVPGIFEIFWPPTLLVLSMHEKPVSSVCFSPCGSRVVSGSYDQTVRVWDTQSGVQVLPPLRGHQNSITSVNISPDGFYIVSGSQDHTIILWDATTGVQTLPPLRGHLASVNSVSFSPEGTWIVSGSQDSTIRVWDTISGKEVRLLRGHEGSVMSVSYSPDGTRIVSGSQDCTIRIWDATSGSLILPPLRAHGAFVLSVSFSPVGDRIVSGSSDGSLRIWDVMSGALIRLTPMEHGGSVNSVVYSSDGTFIVSGSDDWTIRLWDAEFGRPFAPLEGHQDHILSLAFHSGRGMRVVSGSADNTVRVWEVRGLDVLVPNPHMRYQSLERVSDGPLRLVGSPNVRLPGHKGAIVSLAFSPDSSEVVSCSEDMTICIWRASLGMQLHPGFSVHRQCLRLAIFSEDGTKVISISDSDTIRVWDLASFREVHTPPVTRWRPWFKSAVLGQDGTEVIKESIQEVIGPIDPESSLFLSQINLSVERHHRSIQHPDISITQDGWINCHQSTISSRISKLPPMLPPYSVVFASSEEQIAIGTRSGKVVILRFREDEEVFGGLTKLADCDLEFIKKQKEFLNRYSIITEVLCGREVKVKVWESRDECSDYERFRNLGVKQLEITI